VKEEKVMVIKVEFRDTFSNVERVLGYYDSMQAALFALEMNKDWILGGDPDCINISAIHVQTLEILKFEAKDL
jgi:hypothetical protein